jgi:hypothetical protein
MLLLLLLELIGASPFSGAAMTFSSGSTHVTTLLLRTSNITSPR